MGAMSLMNQTTYEYNAEYQTVVQLRNGTLVHSMYVPEKDLDKLRLLLWSIDIDKQIESANTIETFNDNQVETT